MSRLDDQGLSRLRADNARLRAAVVLVRSALEPGGGVSPLSKSQSSASLDAKTRSLQEQVRAARERTSRLESVRKTAAKPKLADAAKDAITTVRGLQRQLLDLATQVGTSDPEAVTAIDGLVSALDSEVGKLAALTVEPGPPPRQAGAEARAEPANTTPAGVSVAASPAAVAKSLQDVSTIVGARSAIPGLRPARGR